jgi:hypothetical protein
VNRLLAAGMFLCVAAAPLAAQQWSVDAHAGRIRSALDPTGIGIESIAVGAHYEKLNSGLRISVGVPTSSEQPLWGAIAGAHRFAVKPGAFIAGIDVAANAFVLHDRVARRREIDDVFRRPQTVAAPAQSGYAGALQAMPVIGYQTPTVQFQLRGGISRYTSDIAEQRRDRNVTLADAQVTFLPTPSIALMPAIRHFITDEGEHTYGAVTALVGHGPLNVWGSTGHWFGLDQQETTWAAGAGVRVHDRVTLSATGRHDVFDPLYATPGQTAWSVGVSVKLGEVMPGRLPVPAVFDAGQATIRLPVSQAPSAPRVAGDFTSWKPQPMQRSGNHWVYTVALKPGVYNYAFVNPKGDWFVPEKHPGRKQDGMGGEVAVLVVR